MYKNIMDEWCIPNDHSHQTTSIDFVKKFVTQHGDIKRVMDLGCGSGDSVDLFRQIDPNINWIGLDIEGSPEVGKRTRKDAEFCSFNGTNIPFDDDHFDLIYCNQVLEHVKYPSKLLKEVARVL